MEHVSILDQSGRVTIPITIMRHLGIRPGDTVAFAVASDGAVSVRRAAVGAFPGPESELGSIPALTAESLDLKREVEGATAEEMARRYPPGSF